MLSDSGFISKTLTEFGVVAGLLILTLIFLAAASWWMAKNVLLPVTRGMLEYVGKQTDATQRTITTLDELEKLENEIKQHITQMAASHNDKNSVFSTVHTNKALALLAEAVRRIATASDIDIEELIVEIKSTLKRQQG